MNDIDGDEAGRTACLLTPLVTVSPKNAPSSQVRSYPSLRSCITWWLGVRNVLHHDQPITGLIAYTW